MTETSSSPNNCTQAPGTESETVRLEEMNTRWTKKKQRRRKKEANESHSYIIRRYAPKKVFQCFALNCIAQLLTQSLTTLGNWVLCMYRYSLPQLKTGRQRTEGKNVQVQWMRTPAYSLHVLREFAIDESSQRWHVHTHTPTGTGNGSLTGRRHVE